MILSLSLEHLKGVENRRLKLNSRQKSLIELIFLIELFLSIIIVKKLSFHQM